MDKQKQIGNFVRPEIAAIADRMVRRFAGKPFESVTLRELQHTVEAVACREACKGLRVIEVSDVEAQLYANTDLSGIDPQEWRQSYPLILVSQPGTERIIAVMVCDWIKNINQNGHQQSPLIMLSYVGKGEVDFLIAFNDIELALTRRTDGTYEPDGPPDGISRRIGRVALNAVLHLSNYPELYGKYANATNRFVIRNPRPDGSLKRMELIPQTIRLRDPIPAEPKELNDPSEEPGLRSLGTVMPKRPHWRKGHWRNARVGEGRQQRRHVWIKPSLIHHAAVLDDSKTAIALYRD